MHLQQIRSSTQYTWEISSSFCFYRFHSCLGRLREPRFILQWLVFISHIQECTSWRVFKYHVKRGNLCMAKISWCVSWGLPEPGIWNIPPSGKLCSEQERFLSLEQQCIMTFPGWTVLKGVVANCLCVVILLFPEWIDLITQPHAQYLASDALKCFIQVHK